MSTTHTPLVTVRLAERAGSTGPSQDRIFTTTNAVILLDGASEPIPTERDGGWIAQALGTAVQQRLARQPTGDLVDIVYSAIAQVAEEGNLVPGRGPSTTLSIVRWTNEQVDAYVLGDSPVIVATTDGQLHEVRDDRLDQLPGRQILQQALHKGGFGLDHVPEWLEWIDYQRTMRNRPGGYWIAEATPDAADHAIRRNWAHREVAAVLAITDGVAVGVDRYGHPASWADAMALAAANPKDLLNLVHQVEAGDIEGRRWPRHKRHDDKTVALTTFSPTPSSSRTTSYSSSES